MSEALGNFLADLACDSEQLARFAANPEGMLAAAALSAAERDAILSRDSRRVSSALGALAERAGLGVTAQKPGGKKKKSPGGKKKKSPGSKKKSPGGSRKAPARKTPARKSPGSRKSSR